jgi:ribulose-phosphate 3-epimerase
VHHTVQAIHDAGCRAGLALCPSTPPVAAAEVVADLDLLLCMTVNPGWGGQAFIPASAGKLERLKAMLGPDTALEVDGGIDARTAAVCAAAGATLFVAGTSVFGSPDPGAAVTEIARAAQTT